MMLVYMAVASFPYRLFPSGMLNEECQLNRDVDNVRLAQRIGDLKNPVLKRVAMNSPKNSPNLGRRQGQSRCGPEEAFSVKHYAGVVNYSLNNMIEKNKDKVAQDLVDLVEESENVFLKQLFSDWENPNELRGDYFFCRSSFLLAYSLACFLSRTSSLLSSFLIFSISSFLPPFFFLPLLLPFFPSF